jgi:hypothetical protein
MAEHSKRQTFVRRILVPIFIVLPLLSAILPSNSVRSSVMHSSPFSSPLSVISLISASCGDQMLPGGVIPGCDPLATSFSSPYFRLQGDGPSSIYTAAIDGISIGEFSASPFSNDVVIHVPTALADGTYVLTVQEVSPIQSNSFAPLSFRVDTKFPSVPGTPKVWPESGSATGSATGSLHPTISGTSDPNSIIWLYDEQNTVTPNTVTPNTPLAVVLASSTGAWVTKPVTLTYGVHYIMAYAENEVGHVAPMSGTPVPTLTLLVAHTWIAQRNFGLLPKSLHGTKQLVTVPVGATGLDLVKRVIVSREVWAYLQWCQYIGWATLDVIGSET